MRLAKENSNVYLDTSTVPVYFQEEYPFPTSVKIIQEAYQAVGAEKLLWSSDYPGMLNHATMRELIDMVVRHSKIPQEDLRKIMGENAKKLWFSD